MLKHDDLSEQPICVPTERLSPEALNGLIEEFVTRNGTDYGQREASLAEKCAAMQKQLMTRRAVIICNPSSQTYNIVLADDVQQSDASRREKGTP